MTPDRTPGANHRGHEEHEEHEHGRLGAHGAHGAHGWMMIACCVPMLLIAVLLVATGVVGPGFILAAVGCTLMMALMMRGMTHGGGGRP